MFAHKNHKSIFIWILTVLLTLALSSTFNSICLRTTIFSAHFTNKVLTEPYNAKIITDGVNQQIDLIQNKYPLPIKLPKQMFKVNEIKPVIKTTINRLYEGNPAIFSAQRILDVFLQKLQELTGIKTHKDNLSIIFAKVQAYTLQIISKQLNTPLIQEEVTTFSNSCIRLKIILLSSIVFALLLLILLIWQRQRTTYYVGISFIAATVISVGALWYIFSQMVKIKLPLSIKIIRSFYQQAIYQNGYFLIITLIIGILLLLIDYYHQRKS